MASIKVLILIWSPKITLPFYTSRGLGDCSGVLRFCLCKSIDLYWELSQECLTKAEEFMCSVCLLCDFLAALPLVGCEPVLVSRSCGYWTSAKGLFCAGHKRKGTKTLVLIWASLGLCMFSLLCLLCQIKWKFDVNEYHSDPLHLFSAAAHQNVHGIANGSN